ncbi:MAG: polymer-forming cytoskeletal protein [Vicinamibacteria bacterium]|jgi:cytoskeletal protein CcmA (bactofilin family)|nr:polymer-forming cytoskeletal protein [Vicinamibacteria bacterium]
MGLFGGKNPEPKPAEPASNRPQPVAPAPSSTPAAKPQPCVVGAQTTFKGELSAEEDVLVEGAVEGQIKVSRSLRIGPGGRVKASLQAQSIVISGEVTGDCVAVERVELQATARLFGNIRAPRIVIAEGALFKGQSDMTAPDRGLGARGVSPQGTGDGLRPATEPDRA